MTEESLVSSHVCSGLSTRKEGDRDMNGTLAEEDSWASWCYVLGPRKCTCISVPRGDRIVLDWLSSEVSSI